MADMSRRTESAGEGVCEREDECGAASGEQDSRSVISGDDSSKFAPPEQIPTSGSESKYTALHEEDVEPIAGAEDVHLPQASLHARSP